MRRIESGELAVGSALPWDVYRAAGGLLAIKGHVITTIDQIEVLTERGLVPLARVQAPAEAPPSVVRMLNSVNQRLHLLLGQVAAGAASGAAAQLQGLARDTMLAAQLQPEVALACILHNQQAGPYPVRHSVDTALVALLVACALEKTAAQILTITLGALTMNVAMLADQARMQASAAPLSGADAELIRAHPESGVALLRQAGIEDGAWLDCVLLHHENEDGSGYPFGLRADEIAELAKIVSLADRYCARVSARSYRKPMVPNRALRDLVLQGQSTVNARLAAAFIRELGIYPIGTFVRLQNGEIGVVTHKGGTSTTPVVDALVGPRGAPLGVIIRRDTGDARHAIREVLDEGQAAIGFRLDQLWGRIASA